MSQLIPTPPGVPSDNPEPPALLEYRCPRCATEVTEEYYGPCTTCRSTLRATLGGEQVEVAEVAFEPKMNVTPNAVALKD